MTIRGKTLAVLNLLYGYLPCIVFLLGWCKLWISVPASVALLILVVLFIRQMDNNDSVSISTPVLISTLAVSAGLCLVMGFGGVFANFFDYFKHSAIIQDLVAYDWPVVYTQNEPAMLTYYLGQYLIPSVVGKILHNRIVAELFMGLVGWVGVYLLYLNLVILTSANNGQKQLLLFVMYFLFSGMFLPLYIVYKSLPLNGITFFINHCWFVVEGWLLQYRSTLVALRWVYPQYIVPCIGAAMLYRSKEFKYCALILLPSFLFGTWSFLCLVILTVLRLLIVSIQQGKFNFDIVSIQNVVVALIGCVFLFYYWGNITMSGKPDYMKLSMITTPWYYITAYLPFVLFMFGFYVILVWQDYKTDPVFLAVVVVLLVIPCFRMGYFNDFVMSVSLPAMFLLFSYLFKFMITADSKQKLVKIRKVVLSICLLLACASPITELKSAFPLRIVSFSRRTLSTFTDRDAEVSDDCMKYNYYTYYPEDSFFYKYLSKK